MKPRRTCLRIVGALVGAATLGACVAFPRAAVAQRLPSYPADDAVAAKVDDQPITYAEVKREIAAGLKGRPVPPDALPLVQAQALEQVIARRLLVARFRQLQMAPTPDEIKRSEENLAEQCRRLGISREEFLARNGLTADDFETFRYWEISAERFAREQLTDEQLGRFFHDHRRDFDGTELRVSHVLLRVEGRQDQGDPDRVIAKALQIRREVLEKQRSFAEAAAKYSDGPSREVGGDLGFIPRRGRMIEAFSTAAFRLQPGEISPPIATPFGIHLITVTDVKPGELTLADVREPVYAAAKQTMFLALAAELRKSAKIEYTGIVAHVDVATGRIVPAEAK